MPLVIGALGLKGGSGRTTVATNLAAALAAAGKKVAVVDADVEQGSAQTWAAVPGRTCQVPAVPAGKELRKTIAGLGQVDAVVIDGPPRLGAPTREALLVSHVALLVARPGATDSWALRQTLQLVDEARALRKDLRAFVMWNAVERTVLHRGAMSSLPPSVGVLDSYLKHRALYGEALLAGNGAVDVEPDSDAARDVRHALRELLK